MKPQEPQVGYSKKGKAGAKNVDDRSEKYKDVGYECGYGYSCITGKVLFRPKKMRIGVKEAKEEERRRTYISSSMHVPCICIWKGGIGHIRLGLSVPCVNLVKLECS